MLLWNTWDRNLFVCLVQKLKYKIWWESSYRFHFPQCIGAADGTHISIKQLLHNATDFINQKSRYSINVQACSRYDCQFMDVVMKWPGNVHDARVFTNSSLNSNLKNGVIQNR